jgi:hypothetical protein
VTALLVLPQIVEAQERYHSTFGFSFELGDRWAFVNMVSSYSERMKPAMELIPPATQQAIRSSLIEVALLQPDSAMASVPSIAIARMQGTVPDSVQLTQACSDFVSNLSQESGTPVELGSCTLGKVGGLEALFFETEVPIDGSRSISARIQASPDVLIMISASADGGSYERIRTVFDSLLESIIWD